MTYSCSDLADDVLADVVGRNLVAEPPGSDPIEPSDQADLIMEGIAKACDGREEAGKVIAGLLLLIPTQPSDGLPSSWPERARALLAKIGGAP